MKTKLLLLALAFSSQVFSQQSFQVSLLSNPSNVISPNQVIQVISVEEDAVKYTYDVKNTSAGFHKYIVKRYNILLHSGADATFCFAGQCYDNSKTESPDSLKLAAGKKASELNINGSTGVLDIDLTETGPIGKSIIRYSIMDANNHADSLQMTFSYNNAITGINEFNSNNVSSVTLFPNPAKDNTSLKINSSKETAVQIKVYSLLGEAVYSENVSIFPGENEIKIDTRDYAKGIYFVNVPNGNSVVTRKLVIN